MEQTRAFSYIGDLAPIIAESIDVPGAYNQIFNIGADQPYTINVLAAEIGKAMAVEPLVMYVPARNEVVHAYSSHEKVQRVFGARQLATLEEGLAKMAAWVKDHGARQSKEFQGVEVMKNFPKAWLISKNGRSS